MPLAPRVGHSPRWYQGPLPHCFPLWASSPIASARAYIPPSAFHSRRSFLAGRVRDRLAFSPRIWQWCPLLLRPHLLSWRDLFPETFLRLSFPSRSLAQANFLQSVTGDVRPPGRSQLGRLPCLFLTFSAMKFTKKYQTYMDGMEAELPGVGLKRLKKMLKKCRSELRSHREAGDDDSGCPGHCSVCDGSFFPCLLDEMSAVVGSFNEKAKKLLQLHLASGFKRYVLWFTSKGDRSHGTLIKQGKDLVTYAIINAVAMRKILKKYDKIHYSKQGQAFKAQAQSLHIEILQSPWLCELMAFYMNLRRSKRNKAAIELFSDCSLIFDDDRPTLTCNLFDSMRVDISLTCSICLDTVFDPVSLSCGHIFCYLCCCSAASVTIVDGLKSADHKAKCPLCRQEGVFPNAVHLDELNMLLSHSCPEYWERRLQLERVERVRLAKEHWESQCRAFLGIK